MIPFTTVLIGFGRIAAGNAADPVMSKPYKYACHAQVLKAHPAYDWQAVVDPSPEARRRAREDWGVKHVFATLEELHDNCPPDIAVISTPPGARLEIMQHLPEVRAILVEKPLGTGEDDAAAFVAVCQRREIPVQVNFWRRADRTFRALAAGELENLVGETQAAFGIYGNGLRNNGIHMVDFVRMLIGEISWVQVPQGAGSEHCGPLRNDVEFPFSLGLANGVVVQMQPVDFANYRENGLDIWGTRGRLSIMQDCRTILHCPMQEHGGLSGTREIGSDRPRSLATTFGEALYEMHDDLARSLTEGSPLVCPATDALKSERVIDALLRSRGDGGRVIRLENP